MFLPCLVGRLLFFLSAINAFCADLYIASARDAFGQAIPAKATSSPSDLPTTIHQQQSPQLSPKSELVADALIIPRSAKDAVLESGSQSDVALESGSQSDAAIELGSESDTVLESVDPGTAVQTGVCERMLLVSTLDGRLSAVDAVRGRLLWSVGVAGGGMFQSSLHPSAGVVPSLDGRLFRWQDGSLTQLPVSVQALLGSSRQAVLGPWQRGQLLLSGASSVSTFGVELRSGRLLYRCETEGCRTVGVGRPGESVLVLRQHRHVLLAADPLTGRQRWNVSVAQHEVAMAGGEDRDLATSCGAQQQFGTAVPEGKVWTDQEGMRWSHQFSAPLVHAWSVANGISQPLDLFIAEKGSSASPADLYFGVHRNQMYVQSLGRFSSVEGPSAMTAASFAISGVSQERSQQLQHLYTDQAPVLLSDDAGFLLYATECDNPQLSVSPWPEQRPPGQAPPAGWGLHVLVLSVTATVLANLLVTRRMRAHYQRAAARAIWNFVRLSLPRLVLREAMVPLDVKEAVRTPDRPLPAASSRSRYLEEFEPLSCLGSGGYGVVFEARNMLDDQRYAVKRTRLPAGARQRRRVLREVACLARLEHTNIVRYFNCWTERLSLEDVRLQDAAAPRAVSPSTGVPQSSQCDSPTPASCPPSSSRLFVAAEGVAGQWKHRTLVGARSPGLSALHSLSLPPSDPLHSDGVQFLASGDDRSAGGPAQSSSSGVVCRSEGDDSVVFEAGSGHVLLDISVASESSSHSPLLAWQSHCGDEDDEEEESGDQAVFLFIQVQLCRPETLRHWLQSTAETRTRSRAEALRIFLQILDGVDHLHSQQLMHRDLKPSNIFFALDGVVKIGDFGLATPLGDCGRGGDCMEQGHTDHVGTRLYMSPEQAAPGARLYDWRVDVFALGLLLLEMLVPFSTGAERVSVLTAAREGWLPKPLAGPDNVSGLLVSDMTAHLPQQRPSIAQVRLRCSQIQCCAL